MILNLIKFMSINYFIILLTCITLTTSAGEDLGFAYPEEPEHDKSKHNSMNKVPVTLDSRCGENEYLYPGDHKDDYVCDCIPGHVYYPPTNKCYPVYRQGPCKNGLYLILKEKTVIPECVQNTCGVDGKVYFNKGCYEMNDTTPCPLPELGFVISVNETTLALQCISNSVAAKHAPPLPMLMEFPLRFGDDEEVITTTTTELPYTATKCLKGSKRAFQGQCSNLVE